MARAAVRQIRLGLNALFFAGPASTRLLPPAGDGQSLGFVDQESGQMKKLALSGGAPVVISNASNTSSVVPTGLVDSRMTRLPAFT